MSRLAAIAICLIVFLVLLSCSAQPENPPVAMKAQMDVAELENFSQKHQLTTEEVKSITQNLLDKGNDIQQEIFATGQVSADKAGARVSQTMSQASMAAERVPVPEGSFDSIEKIKEKVESVFTPEAATEYYQELFEGTDPIFLEKDGVLYYYSQYTAMLPLMDYDVESSIVMRQTIDEITVEVTITTPGSTPVKKSLNMKKLGEEWRLDSVIFP